MIFEFAKVKVIASYSAITFFFIPANILIPHSDGLISW